MPPRDVLAAGAVVSRPGREVLLVHRPRYDDWSFPKGKLDPGEHHAVAAVREVLEETGLQIRLGPRLTTQRYPTSNNGGGRMKTVDYWVGWVVGDDDVSGYVANAEIDQVAWVPVEEAMERLTYDHDRQTLVESRGLRKRSHALVVLRHGAARQRRTWRRDDRLRPLAAAGGRQAERLVPLLAAYDVSRVVTSSSARCAQSVAPYAAWSGWPLEEHDGLSEEGATAESVVEVVDDLLHADESSVLCSHRPVLPAVFDALGLPDPGLPPAGMLVVHHRKGKVLSTEVHCHG
jgi:8-oxo-dGTP diphosphatase